MRKIDELAAVIELACLTEDRDPEEQRALLAVALRVDRERGSFRSMNLDHLVAPHLFVSVQETYRPSEGRRVEPTQPQLRKYVKLEQAWTPCPECGQPDGVHYTDGQCPNTVYSTPTAPNVVTIRPSAAL